jgi:hypothetical protein
MNEAIPRETLEICHSWWGTRKKAQIHCQLTPNEAVPILSWPHEFTSLEFPPGTPDCGLFSLLMALFKN